MAAVINQKPSSSAEPSNYRRIELITKVEGQVARIIQFLILNKEEGFLTISEDKSFRILLKRDNGQFWPSVIEYLPNVPTCLFVDEENNLVFVGLVTGVIVQYQISEDWNSLELVRRFQYHLAGATGVVYSDVNKQIVSCGRDKTVIWSCTETGNKVGFHKLDSALSCIKYEPSTGFAFVGSFSGSIYVLRISGVAASLITSLNAHSGAISDLAWNPADQLLFSASNDNLVVMWDIGGKKGDCFELNGHDSRLTSLALLADNKKLLSVDDHGHLVCWDLTAKRNVTPPWKEANNCNLCDTPFFWNVKEMWERKVVGCRRHHCRTCGRSVCDNCCKTETIFPGMGFEKPVRICRTCKEKMDQYPDQFDLTPLSTQTEIRQNVVDMHLNRAQDRMATVGTDRTILVWDMKPLL